MRTIGECLSELDFSSPEALVNIFVTSHLGRLRHLRQHTHDAFLRQQWEVVWDFTHRFENGRWRPGQNHADAPLSDAAEGYLYSGDIPEIGRTALALAFHAAMSELDQAIAEAAHRAG